MKNNAQSNSGGKNSDNLKIISQEMESVALKALEIAKKLGADDAKISASCSFQKRLVVENKVFTLANSLDTQKFGILVQKDNKKGSASINSRNPDAIAQAIKDALSLASFSVPDEHMTMSTPDIAPPTKAHAFQYDAATADIGSSYTQQRTPAFLSISMRCQRTRAFMESTIPVGLSRAKPRRCLIGSSSAWLSMAKKSLGLTTMVTLHSTKRTLARKLSTRLMNSPDEFY